ncbi:MAG: RNA polymerase sigma factor [Opitutaceae bacterium]
MSSPTTTSDQAPTADQTQLRWFTEEVHAHDASLKSYLRGSFPSERDLDDVVQESYLRIWKARTREPINSVKAFLFRVARNIALDRTRRHRTSPLGNVGNLDASCVMDDRPGVIEIVSEGEKERLLSDALSALPPRAHELIILCKLNGLSHRAAAEKLGISERTVDEHLLRGTKRLGEELRKRGLCDLYER